MLDRPGAAPRKVWDRSAEDAYSNPGAPLRHVGPSGGETIEQTGDTIYLSGNGASPQGDRPFLDTLNLTTLATQRAYQMTEGYEPVLGLLSDDGSRILTRFETRSTPPTTLGDPPRMDAA